MTLTLDFFYNAPGLHDQTFRQLNYQRGGLSETETKVTPIMGHGFLKLNHQ